MSLRSLFPHTCTIRRNTESARDAFGRVVNTTVDSTSVPCRLSKPKATADTSPTRGVAVDHVLYLMPGQGIDESDEVRNVTDAEGNTLLSFATVSAVHAHYGARNGHHKSAELVEARNG